MALIIIGLGLLTVYVGGIGDPQPWRIDHLIWLGWGSIIALLQIWHLFFSVNVWAMTLLASLALLGWLLPRLSRKSLFVRQSQSRGPALMTIVAAAGFAFWLANRAGGSIAGVGDAGLYHVGMIRWLTDAPIVRGLGNVHGRFAFNNSSFLYYALLDIGPLTRQSYHLAGGFLLLATGLTFLKQTAVLIFTPGVATKENWLAAVLLGFILHLSFIYGASTSPDLIMTLLTLVVGCALFRLLFVNVTTREAEKIFFFIVFLSAVGITVKLSIVFFSGLASLAALINILQRRQESLLRLLRRRTFLVTVAAGSLVLFPWIIRNVLLSGYLIYPGISWHLNVIWRVPLAQMIDEARWIQSWARQPWVYHAEVLSGWTWLGPWLRAAATLRIEIVLPLLLVAGGGIGSLILRSKVRPHTESFLWAGVLSGSLLFWFLTAPAIRFAGGILWLLAGSVLALNITRRRLRQQGYWFGLTCLLITLFIGRYDAQLFGTFVPNGPGRYGLYPMPTIETYSYITESGLTIYVPTQGYSCWAAQLPCTPYPVPTLTTIAPDDWRSGFVQPADIVQIDWPPVH